MSRTSEPGGPRAPRGSGGRWVLPLTAMVLASLGPAPAEPYRFYSDGLTEARIVGAEHAVRWSELSWAPGETLVFEVAPDPDFTALFGSPEGVIPYFERALAAWSDIPTADIKLRVGGVIEDDRNPYRPTLYINTETDSSQVSGYASSWDRFYLGPVGTLLLRHRYGFAVRRPAEGPGRGANWTNGGRNCWTRSCPLWFTRWAIASVCCTPGPCPRPPAGLRIAGEMCSCIRGTPRCRTDGTRNRRRGSLRTTSSAPRCCGRRHAFTGLPERSPEPCNSTGNRRRTPTSGPFPWTPTRSATALECSVTARAPFGSRGSHPGRTHSGLHRFTNTDAHGGLVSEEPPAGSGGNQRGHSRSRSKPARTPAK